jgi:Skp family chaperone for outer membrane proteins
MLVAIATAALSAALLGPAALVAAAAPDRPTRVAVVSIPRVFDEMQETKDAKVRLRQDQQRLAAESKTKVDELQKMRAEGGNFRRGSDQYTEWRQRMMRATIQAQAWEATAKQELDWRVKNQTRDTFEKIAAAVAEYANSNQIDLVLSDHQPTLTDEDLEKNPADKISAAIDQRRVVYASKNIDISDAIIAALDAKYKAAGGAGAAPAPVGIGQGNNATNANTAGATLRGNEQPEGPGGPRKSNNR